MLGLLSNSVKIRKPPGLVGVKIVRGLVKKKWFDNYFGFKCF